MDRWGEQAMRGAGQRLARLTASVMHDVYRQRCEMSQTYRRLAEGRTGPLGEYYLARAKHLETLAERALRFARQEDQAGTDATPSSAVPSGRTLRMDPDGLGTSQGVGGRAPISAEGWGVQ